jgi:hypothetical protein
MPPKIGLKLILTLSLTTLAIILIRAQSTDLIQEVELLDFVKKGLIQRQERLLQQLKPAVSICHTPEPLMTRPDGFVIPGGVFISASHCWAAVTPNGVVEVGLDDFAGKLLGKAVLLFLDDIERCLKMAATERLTGDTGLRKGIMAKFSTSECVVVARKFFGRADH